MGCVRNGRSMFCTVFTPVCIRGAVPLPSHPPWHRHCFSFCSSGVPQCDVHFFLHYLLRLCSPAVYLLSQCSSCLLSLFRLECVVELLTVCSPRMLAVPQVCAADTLRLQCIFHSMKAFTLSFSPFLIRDLEVIKERYF